MVAVEAPNRSMSYIFTSKELSMVPVSCHCQVVPGAGAQTDPASGGLTIASGAIVESAAGPSPLTAASSGAPSAGAPPSAGVATDPTSAEASAIAPGAAVERVQANPRIEPARTIARIILPFMSQ